MSSILEKIKGSLRKQSKESFTGKKEPGIFVQLNDVLLYPKEIANPKTQNYNQELTALLAEYIRIGGQVTLFFKGDICQHIANIRQSGLGDALFGNRERFLDWERDGKKSKTPNVVYERLRHFEKRADASCALVIANKDEWRVKGDISFSPEDLTRDKFTAFFLMTPHKGHDQQMSHRYNLN